MSAYSLSACLCLGGNPCKRPCSDADMTTRFSRRLSVLSPLMWWTCSLFNKARPSAFSIMSRCSFRARRLIFITLYPYTSNPCFLNCRDTRSFSSGWLFQNIFRDADIFAFCSVGFGTPLKWAALFRRSISNLMSRFLTVLRCTPNSSAIDSIDRCSYSCLNQIGLSNLFISELYTKSNRLPS